MPLTPSIRWPSVVWSIIADSSTHGGRSPSRPSALHERSASCSQPIPLAPVAGDDEGIDAGHIHRLDPGLELLAERRLTGHARRACGSIGPRQDTQSHRSPIRYGTPSSQGRHPGLGCIAGSAPMNIASRQAQMAFTCGPARSSAATKPGESGRAGRGETRRYARASPHRVRQERKRSARGGLVERAPVGPEADRVVLPAPGRPQPDLQLGVADGEVGEGAGIDVRAQQPLDRVGFVGRERLELQQPAGGALGCRRCKAFTRTASMPRRPAAGGTAA